MAYKHILAAVASLEEDEILLGRAQALAGTLGARLSLVHVIDAVMPTAPFGPDALGGGAGDLGIVNTVEITENLVQAARTRVEAMAAKFGIAAADISVRVGAHAAEILDGAEELGADLVVVGHYPHRGWSALFSHTESTIVHRARCDVLSIMLGGEAAK